MKKEIFYKYRTMNTNLIELLCYDKIFYASPATFNDPLDCQMFVLENDSSVEDLRKIYARLKYPKILQNAEREIRGPDFKKNMKLLLAEMAKECGLAVVLVKPTRTKLKAEDFNRITGWQGRTNQEQRDAGMLIWRMK